MFLCFKPGDIVLAWVLKIAGSSSKDWVLSTSEVEHGVLIAECEQSGEMMIPWNFTTMQCPITKVEEKWKVAKPIEA